jgi:hypothetical protein
MAFQILRTYLNHLGENHPSIKRVLVWLRMDDAA